MTDADLAQFARTSEQLLAALKPNAKTRRVRQAGPEPSPHDGTSESLLQSSANLNFHPPSKGHRNERSEQQSMAAPITIANGSVTRRDDEWKGRAEVGVRIEGLPKGVTTLDVYRCFKNEGTISRIKVPHSQSSSPSYVNFSPPPHRAFFFGEGPPIVFRDSRDNVRYKLIYSITRELTFRMPSPINPDIEYDEFTRLAPDTLDFGFMQSKREYVVMHPVSTRPGRPIHLTLNLRFKKLIIEFGMSEHSVHGDKAAQNIAERAVKYRFEIPIRNIGCIYQIGSNADERQLLFTAVTPPQFYRKTHRIEGTHDPMSTEWMEWWAWFRQTDVTREPESLDRQAITLCKKNPIIDLGRWTTYRLRMSSTPHEQSKFDIFRRALTDHGVLFHSVTDLEIRHTPSGSNDIWRHLDPGDHTEGTSSLSLLDTEHTFLAFAVRYQLEVCISQSVINEHNITKEFLINLINLGEQRATSLLETAALSNGKLNGPFYDPNKLLKLSTRKPSKKRNNGHFAYMRAAQVTPTMVYYSTPILETSNRIIRQFYAYEDRFLRVRFSDEDGKIHYKDRDINEELFVRVRRALVNGLRIGDRHYEFLAFGNSQFRENAAYFFASTRDLQASDIRTWMGDLRGIKLVAKWSARLGQSFSTTRSIHSARVKVNTETDIVRNGYNFSDGVGKISPFLAQLVAHEFGLKIDKNTCPSLFQFRMGGCKGVLVVDPTLAGSQEVVIRESQFKFPATHEGLDVIRYSSFAATMLNRQIIILLDTLGVKPTVFLDKQRSELAELESAMSDRDTAVRLLQKRIDFNQMTLSVASLVLDGFMDSGEPFVMSILQLWRAWNIKYLKEKARITIDAGAFLLGCVDESGNLRGHYSDLQRCRAIYGPDRSQWVPEIFLQVRDPPYTGPYKVRTGLCLLARNPSLHPGDLRVVRAVDIPDLHHLRDVVVLPQNGDRDIASMCSGGDLDGDDYLVIWDKDLFPTHNNWNREAMDFQPPKGPLLDREVNIDDVRTFFVEYMKNNKLELIAVSHLAQADLHPEGVDSYKCIELAKLHSCAVDYAKAGVPARLPRELIPRKWPHFMGKDEKISYKSKSVLGRLYDEVQLVDFKPLFESEFDRRILDAYDFQGEDMVDRTSKVREIKVEYDKSVRRIMAKHAIGSEFEVWSTFVLSHNRDKGDYKFHEEIGNLAYSLKTQYQDEIIDAAGGRTFKELEPWVAAMYKVTADEMAEAVIECSQTGLVGGRERPIRQGTTTDMPLMSFPWIFHHELGKIATRQRDGPEAVKLEHDVTRQALTNKLHRTKVTQSVRADIVIPELETSTGVVRAGQELKLFQDSPESTTNGHPADSSSDGDHSNTDHRLSEMPLISNGAHMDAVKEPLRERDEDAFSDGGRLVERLAYMSLNKPLDDTRATSPSTIDRHTEQDTEISPEPKEIGGESVGAPTLLMPTVRSQAGYQRSMQGNLQFEQDMDGENAGEEEIGVETPALDRLAQLVG